MQLSHNWTCRAVTEAGSDRETPEPSKNMVELLAPFLPSCPADTAAKGAELAPELDTKSSSISGSQSAAEEQQSVHHFVKQQLGDGGLYQVGAAALERVLIGNLPAKQVSDLTQELLKLEPVVRGKLYATYVNCRWPMRTACLRTQNVTLSVQGQICMSLCPLTAQMQNLIAMAVLPVHTERSCKFPA